MTRTRYSTARLREVIGHRDAARAALETATTRLRTAKEAHRLAITNLSEMEAAQPDYRGDDVAMQSQIDRHESTLTRLRDEAQRAADAVEDCQSLRDSVAGRLSTWAALAASGCEFLQRRGLLPADLREAL